MSGKIVFCLMQYLKKMGNDQKPGALPAQILKPTISKFAIPPKWL